MIRKIIKLTLLSVLIGIFVFIIPALHIRVVNAEEEVIDSETFKYDGDKNNYANYLKKHNNAQYPSDVIDIDITSFGHTDNVELSNRGTLLTKEDSNVTFNFHVTNEGYYNLYLKYYPTDGNGLTIQRKIRIDDEFLFDEMSLVIFYRYWNDSEEIQTENGNEIRPIQIEFPEIIETYAQDRTKMYNEYYMFYLEAGDHTINLESVREPMEIYEMKFTEVQKIESYENKLNEWKDAGLEIVNDCSFVKVQGENTLRKSSSSIYATSDTTSKLTENHNNEKNHTYQIRLNLIGGANWNNPGDFVEWEIDAPKEGLYQLSVKYLQDNKADLDSIRALYINGELQFKECEEIIFEYTKKFKLKTIGNGYYFHLKEGKNIIRLEATLGKYANAINNVQYLIDSLNELYRTIIVITGVSPDPNVDYQLEAFIPGLVDRLIESNKEIERIIQILTDTTSKKSEETIALNKLYDQIKGFIDNPYSISTDLSIFNSNISSLGTCLNNLRTQPLKIDYLGIHSAGVEKKIRVKESWIGKLWYEIQKLFMSFFVDYDSLGSGTTGDVNIDVWVLTGRDQAQVIKNLVVNDFSVKNPDIGVTVKLVPGSALLPNIQTGNGPDVVLMIGNGTPNEYAFRNSAYDISQFSDINDVIANNYYESALTNLRYNGGIYGLPETISFPVLFYREDILSQLGIPVPNTWEDLIRDIIILQDSNMDVYIPAAIGNTYASLLYQNGGDFYIDHGVSTGLGSDIAIDAFIRWTEFYTKYGVPIAASFVNRFRSGDMPIGISDYSLFNTLVMSAPEIQGKWSMTLLPGTEKEGGLIDRSSISSGTACMIIKDTDHPNESWEFLKWWTSMDIQTSYGREIESILGASARYNAANIHAIEKLPWSAHERNVILEQYSYIKGFENVPGGYMTTRQLDYAFRLVTNENANPRETLIEYIEYINEELTIKRKEFGLE